MCDILLVRLKVQLIFTKCHKHDLSADTIVPNSLGNLRDVSLKKSIQHQYCRKVRVEFLHCWLYVMQSSDMQ